eukprot:CAMPEP_0201498012 /NCGR_PEP_ID=MMETSP0151_2-20130828/68849_1 /ASSEMBLY_ACC=CAM_ASM_000257 /TAXON_ID=200890 /ORGANISM="Paramoeba atlantica, Strain 621/1 / CCAP 1560/9" /LENGTH=221 /DNA_ID=CAMNT_0047889233 /DNA_START=46 /DNA_END=708 /DNA_ORIENTATION=-
MATSQNQETFKSTDSLTKDENVENGLLEKVFPELSCFLDRFNNRGVELFLSCSNEVWDMVCSIVDSLIDFLRRAAECAYNFELGKTSRAQSLNNEEIDEQKQSKYFVVRDLFDEFNTGLSSHFLRPCLFTLYVFFRHFVKRFAQWKISQTNQNKNVSLDLFNVESELAHEDSLANLSQDFFVCSQSPEESLPDADSQEVKHVGMTGEGKVSSPIGKTLEEM